MNEDEELADLLGLLGRAGLTAAAALIEEAFRLASTGHRLQQREDGSPVLAHPVRVARILLEEWRLQEATFVATALLHDVLEEGDGVTAEAIEQAAGPGVRAMVEALTRSGDEDDGYHQRVGAAGRGPVLVKAAERIDNLRHLLGARWSEADKRAYAEEALQVLAPLVREVSPDHADRLEDVASDTLRRLDAGEGDIPDVGPHQDAEAAAGPDRVLRRSPHLSFFRDGANVYLYHDLVGDIIQLHEKVLGFLDFFAEPHSEAEAREAFKSEFLPGDLDAFFETFVQHLVLVPEGDSDRRVVSDWYPIHGPWIVAHHSKTGVKLCYKDRREGDVVLLQLDRFHGRLFQMCTGNLSTSELIRRLRDELGESVDLEERVRAALRGWTHSQRQLLKLLPRPKEAYDMIGLPPYSQSTMPYALLRGSEAPAPEAAAGTHEYHKVDITDADEQFDLKETTVSHGLRVPHPALGGKTYGAALAQGLLGREVLPEAPDARFRLVEVGGGTGYFARAFLDGLALRAPRLFNRLRYTILDLSPALRASQRERTALHADKVKLLGGDAEHLPFADASVDCFVSNEVIADLRVAPVRRADLSGQSGEDGGEGAAAIRKYGLGWDNAPGLFFVNLGAFTFLEEIHRVLRPGGTAVLSEYGTQTGFPQQSTHLDHAEFSIHFGHLEQVARQLGMEASVEALGDLIGLDGSVRVLETTQSFFLTLRAFLSTYGIQLEKVAYTEEMFAELLGDKLRLRDLQGVRFKPCGQRLLGLKPPEFRALVLRKPRSSGRKVKKVSLDL